MDERIAIYNPAYNRDVQAMIAAPNAETAVRLYAGLLACLADNPTGSTVRREGPDQCPAVTAALKAMGAKR